MGLTLDAAMPVASLVCKAHVPLAIRGLGSLLRYARTPLALTLFDDGTLDDVDCETLLAALPGAAILRAGETDPQLAELLARSPRSFLLRGAVPMLRKLLDVPLLMGRSYFYCDCDVLFLRPFSLETVRAAMGAGFVFMRDIREGYSAGLRQFILHRRVPILTKANAGVAAVPYARYDLDFVEWFLGIKAFHVFANMLEQTCWAAMPRGRGASIIDPRQLFCFGRGRRADAETVAVHFIGQAKHELAQWEQHAQSPELPPTDLCLTPAKCAGLTELLTAGLRNRLLPPALR